MQQIGKKNENDNETEHLGKRQGLPLAGQFYGSDGNGGLQVFDLQAELEAMQEEDNYSDNEEEQEEDGEHQMGEEQQEQDNEELELQYGGAYVVKKQKRQ